MSVFLNLLIMEENTNDRNTCKSKFDAIELDILFLKNKIKALEQKIQQTEEATALRQEVVKAVIHTVNNPFE